MLLVALLVVHPVACFLLLMFMIITTKALRIISIAIYTPAIHLPHTAIEKLIQVSPQVVRAGLDA